MAQPTRTMMNALSRWYLSTLDDYEDDTVKENKDRLFIALYNIKAADPVFKAREDAVAGGTAGDEEMEEHDQDFVDIDIWVDRLLCGACTGYFSADLAEAIAATFYGVESPEQLKSLATINFDLGHFLPELPKDDVGEEADDESVDDLNETLEDDETLYCGICDDELDPCEAQVCDDCEVSVHTYCAGLGFHQEVPWYCDSCNDLYTSASNDGETLCGSVSTTDDTADRSECDTFEDGKSVAEEFGYPLTRTTVDGLMFSFDQSQVIDSNAELSTEESDSEQRHADEAVNNRGFKKGRHQPVDGSEHGNMGFVMSPNEAHRLRSLVGRSLKEDQAARTGIKEESLPEAHEEDKMNDSDADGAPVLIAAGPVHSQHAYHGLGEDLGVELALFALTFKRKVNEEDLIMIYLLAVLEYPHRAAELRDALEAGASTHAYKKVFRFLEQEEEAIRIYLGFPPRELAHSGFDLPFSFAYSSEFDALYRMKNIASVAETQGFIAAHDHFHAALSEVERGATSEVAQSGVLMTEYKATVDRYKGMLHEKDEAHKKTIVEMAKHHQAEVDQLKEQHKERLESLRDEHEARLGDAGRDYEAQLHSQQERFSSKLAQKDRCHMGELEALREKHAVEIELLKKDAEAEWKKRSKIYNFKLDSASFTHRRQSHVAEAQMERLRDEHEVDLAEMKDNHVKQLDQAKTECDAKVAALQATCDGLSRREREAGKLDEMKEATLRELKAQIEYLETALRGKQQQTEPAEPPVSPADQEPGQQVPIPVILDTAVDEMQSTPALVPDDDYLESLKVVPRLSAKTLGVAPDDPIFFPYAYAKSMEAMGDDEPLRALTTREPGLRFLKDPPKIDQRDLYDHTGTCHHRPDTADAKTDSDAANFQLVLPVVGAHDGVDTVESEEEEEGTAAKADTVDNGVTKNDEKTTTMMIKDHGPADVPAGDDEDGVVVEAGDEEEEDWTLVC